MANQDVQTKLITCNVKKTDPKVVVKATLSHPKSGGWSIFLDGTFKQGGNDPVDVDLGAGAAVIGKILEVSGVMKNITNAAVPMKMGVDAPGVSDSLQSSIDPGHAAHDSIFVVFLEKP